MEDTVKRVLKEYNVRLLTILLCFRVGKCVSLLLPGERTLSFHTERGKFWEVDDLKYNWPWR